MSDDEKNPIKAVWAYDYIETWMLVLRQHLPDDDAVNKSFRYMSRSMAAFCESMREYYSKDSSNENAS